MRDITMIQQQLERLKYLISTANDNQATINKLVKELLNKEEQLIRHDK